MSHCLHPPQHTYLTPPSGGALVSCCCCWMLVTTAPTPLCVRAPLVSLSISALNLAFSAMTSSILAVLLDAVPALVVLAMADGFGKIAVAASVALAAAALREYV